MKRLQSSQRKGRRSLVGAVAVELGLSLLFLVPLTVGVVELGRTIYAYDTLVKSVRSSARYLSVGESDDTARQLEAKCIAVTGSPGVAGGACGGTALLPGLTTAMVTILQPNGVGASPAVQAIATGAGTISVITVSISGYTLSTLGTTIFPNLAFGPVSATVPFIFF